MKRQNLGEFEEIVLLIVAKLGGTGYGVSITHEIQTQTGREVRLNQVHASLQRLEGKGMVKSYLGDATAERGGRRKRIVMITAFGIQTLQEVQAIRATLWKMIPSTVKPG
jgi:DNA-binding PadR family transcriptional regulator